MTSKTQTKKEPGMGSQKEQLEMGVQGKEFQMRVKAPTQKKGAKKNLEEQCLRRLVPGTKGTGEKKK